MRIGEMSKILSMPVETIRFYEQKGVISPARSGEGNYRDYSIWDLFDLTECIHYRNMGLSINETVKMMHKMPLSYLSGKLNDRMKQFERQISREQLLLTTIREYCELLQSVKYNLGNYWVGIRKQHSYVVSCKRRAGEYDPQSQFTVLPTWYQKMGIAKTLQIVELEDIRNDVVHDVWAIAMETEAVRVLKLPVDDSVRILPGCLCFFTIYDAGMLGTLTHEHFQAILGEMAARKLKPSGMFSSFMISRCWEDGGYHRYMLVTIPIET